MNLGRFHSAITELRFAMEVEKIISRVTSLQNALQQSIQQPNPETATAFKNQYADVMKTLENSRTNTVFPTRKMIFDEIGASPRIGTGLLNRIEAIFNENLITPAKALVDIQKITAELSEFYKQIKVVESAFDYLQVEYDDLEAGKFEIGFSLPKKIIGQNLELLAYEFKEIDYAIRTLQEIAGESGGSPEIKAISASDWQIFLESAPEAAACISIAIERIVALYKNNLEIRLLKKQLDEKNLPQEVTQPLQDHIEKTVKLQIKEISNQLIDDIYKGDEGRRNELKAKAPQALRYLADRIDKGATIEVHAEPLRDEDAVVGENASNAIENAKRLDELKATVESVNNRMTRISEIKRTDEPTLLIDYDKDERE